MSDDAKPKEVAVVIPAYNAGLYLPRAIDSVLAQTYRDYQIFVIDDGSTDDTPNVLDAYAGRIVSVRQPHAGAAAARNRGIRLSNNPYVAFLDADDEWLPTKLEQQIAVLKQDPDFGMVYSDCSTDGTGPFSGPHFARVGVPPSGRVFQQLLQGCTVHTPTVLARRGCLECVGPFDQSLRVGEDYNMWLRIAASSDIAVVSDVLAIRHITPGSLGQTTSVDDALGGVIAAFEHLAQQCRSLTAEDAKALRNATAAYCYKYGSYLLEKGERRSSRRRMIEARRYGMRDWKITAKLGLGLLPAAAFAFLRKLKMALATLSSAE